MLSQEEARDAAESAKTASATSTADASATDESQIKTPVLADNNESMECDDCVALEDAESR